jgi:hypothetical protein
MIRETRACTLCGGPIRFNNKIGICRMNDRCKLENTRKLNQGAQERRLARRHANPATAPMTREQYQQSRRRGVCRIRKCGRPHAAKGLCAPHRRRELLGLPVNVEIPRIDKPRAICRAGDCGRFVEARGLCTGHYGRWQKGVRGDALLKPLRGMRRKGTGRINPDGYVIAFRNGKVMGEHRFIMEDLLGRPLRKGETVHHRNGQKADNTTDGPLDDEFKSGNLELWSKSQPAGQRVADKIAWARELLALYGEAP